MTPGLSERKHLTQTPDDTDDIFVLPSDISPIPFLTTVEVPDNGRPLRTGSAAVLTSSTYKNKLCAQVMEKASKQMRNSDEDQQEPPLVETDDEDSDEHADTLSAFRKANVACLLSIERSNKEELFDQVSEEANLRHRQKKDKEGLVKISSNVTEQLLSISRHLADTTQRSADTLDSLANSSGNVQNTQQELLTTGSVITQSGKLLDKYGRREFTDKICHSLRNQQVVLPYETQETTKKWCVLDAPTLCASDIHQSRLKLATLWLVFCCCLAVDRRANYSSVTCPESCSCLFSLTCDEGGLTEIPANLSTLTMFIRISNSNISTIPPDAFIGLSAVDMIILEKNNIRIIDPYAFRGLAKFLRIGLTKLTELSISRNKLEEIKKGIFSNLTSLEFLDLSVNRIQRIESGSFSDLSNLERLDLYLNTIEHINRYTFHGLYNLTSLSMNSNFLKIIKRDTFINTPNLLSLSLGSNTIEELEIDAFRGLNRLHELSISANRLSKVDGKYFKGMESLKTLDLSRNAIHAVSPNDFKFLTNLVTLDLSINRISCVHPDSFMSNSVLNKLSLGYNHHLNIPTEESLINSNSLKSLDLSNSNIAGLPSKIFQNTTKLGTISLNGNQLETLEKETFSHLDGLVHLDVHNNDFTCDCKLASAYRWAQNRTVFASVECKNPLEYAGSSWAVLNGTCKNFTTTSRQNVRKKQSFIDAMRILKDECEKRQLHLQPLYIVIHFDQALHECIVSAFPQTKILAQFGSGLGGTFKLLAQFGSRLGRLAQFGQAR
uniref:LRRCT domain-containing protein n=1 Tax=Timema bartmani TaxID=61472 RepID=A0A7R9I385_9NEOP|nr:unnamed protein product [Timema bartmani]